MEDELCHALQSSSLYICMFVSSSFRYLFQLFRTWHGGSPSVRYSALFLTSARLDLSTSAILQLPNELRVLPFCAGVSGRFTSQVFRVRPSWPRLSRQIVSESHPPAMELPLFLSPRCFQVRHFCTGHMAMVLGLAALLLCSALSVDDASLNF